LKAETQFLFQGVNIIVFLSDVKFARLVLNLQQVKIQVCSQWIYSEAYFMLLR
jgi:hypothetical protein